MRYVLLFCCVIVLISSCNSKDSKKYTWRTMEVTATAYNTLASQTSSEPNITAFGDYLKPGMKCIAVSRNLLALGFKHNTMLTIKGLDGIYLVKDKMHKRWIDKIDIYMGLDIKAAKA